MVSSTTSSAMSPIERLPLLVLETICEYLDDESDDRRDLWAFSLVSRRCCAAAEIKRFCQIVLPVPSLDDLGSVLGQLEEVLGRGSRYGLVRRLKIQGKESSPTGPRSRPGRLRKGKGTWDGGDDDDPDDRKALSDGNERIVFAEIHPFCRLRRKTPRYHDRGDHPTVWLPLADLLLQRLPALGDLVWAGSDHVPRSVLDAVNHHHVRRRGGCRLHLSGFNFVLRSLIFPRGARLQPTISPDDFALVTSPSLCSISANVCEYAANGDLDYTDVAVQRMLAGLAPNLAHAWVGAGAWSQRVDLWSAHALGRPPWQGLFPGSGGEEEKSTGRRRAEEQRPTTATESGGNLQSLIYMRETEPEILFEAGDQCLSRLRRLHMCWDVGAGAALADLAARGALPALDALWLVDIHGESAPTRDALSRLLGSLTHPLRHLSLSGAFSRAAVDVLTRRHGAALRFLALNPYDCGCDFHDDPRGEDGRLFALSAAAAEQLLSARCPHLEDLVLHMDRTRGDGREVGIYRALGRLPRLRRLALHLRFAVGPEPDRWDADGERLTPAVNFEESYPVEELREAFSNCATDARLARSIFDLISAPGGPGSLRYLRIEPQLQTYRLHHSIFFAVVRVLARQWVCRREEKKDGDDDDGGCGVVVREVGKNETEGAARRCSALVQKLKNNSVHQIVEDYIQAINNLWPGTEEWWNEWTSLPLSA